MKNSKIEWNKITPAMHVRDTGSSYVALLPDGTEALCTWSTQDAHEAQRTLCRLAARNGMVMQSIRTTYHGPTNHRGSRITATASEGHKVTVPYPYGLSGEACHRVAVDALLAKLGWDDVDAQAGGWERGYVYTLSPRAKA